MVDQSVVRLLTGLYGAEGETVLGPHAEQRCSYRDVEHVTRAPVGGATRSSTLPWSTSESLSERRSRFVGVNGVKRRW